MQVYVVRLEYNVVGGRSSMGNPSSGFDHVWGLTLIGRTRFKSGQYQIDPTIISVSDTTSLGTPNLKN